MYQSSHNSNITFEELAQYSENKPINQFDANFFVAFTCAKSCADKQATDPTTRGNFKAIEKKIATAQKDPRVTLTSAESSLIRRWYLKSLEN